MIRAGELRERVNIHGTAKSVDARWGVSHTSTTTATVWAKVEELSAEERMGEGGVQSEFTHRVTIRHRAGITDQHTLTWRGRTLEISGIVPDPRRTEMVITCREQPQEVANG